MPPRMNVVATIQVENSTRLMKSWSAAPSTAAGRNATMIESAKCRALGARGRSTTAPHSLCQYRTTIARMAPSWMTTSKDLAHGLGEIDEIAGEYEMSHR